MAFHVGQKVVCINTRGWSKINLSWEYPKDQQIYTIREILTAPDGETVIRLEEIINRVGPNFTLNIFCEPYFAARRFRPIIEKKATTDTGMAILHEILDRETVKDTSPSKVRS